MLNQKSLALAGFALAGVFNVAEAVESGGGAPSTSYPSPAAGNQAARTGNAQIVEAARLAYTGFDKNQREPLLKLLDKDVVFEFPQSLPYGGTYRGVEEFKAFWKLLYSTYYDYFNYDAHAVIDAGDYVLVPVTARARAKNGKVMENEHLFLFQVKDGKIVYGRIYADTAKGRDVLEGIEPRLYPKPDL
jgi:ketosteroid isomerase-like protein